MTRGGRGRNLRGGCALAGALLGTLPAGAEPRNPQAVPPVAPAAAPVTQTTTPGPQSTPPQEITVTGVRHRHDASELTVASTEARAMPGTQNDPVKVIESAPGIARSSFGSDELVLWGTAPQDSRVLVDGVEIPRLFHGSGIRSTVSGDLLRSVTLSPGAYGPEYGRALGGLVQLRTRDLPDDGTHTAVEASTIDGSLFASAKAGDRVRVALGGRYGWLDRTLEAVHARDVSRYYAVPKYADFEGKAQVRLRAGEALDLVALGSTDALRRSLPDVDPLREQRTTAKNAFERVYLRYRRTLADGSNTEVVPWIGWDFARSTASFGSNPAELAQRAFRLGLRATQLSPLWHGATLALGVDATSTSTALSRDGSLAIPPREGDVAVFGEPPGDDVNSDRWRTVLVDVAPYANLDFDLGPLQLSPGLRLDAYLNEASRQTPRVGQTPSLGRAALEGAFEPRLAARVRLSERARLFAAAGLYSQPPAPADLSAVFGTPTLGIESATHVSAGENVDVTEALSVTALGFYRSLRDLTVRDPSPTPKLAHALLQNGSGRSYGAQILVRQRPWHGLSGWIAYTASRSERRDAPGASYRLFDLDEPNLLTIVANAALEGWAFGARFRYATGAPRTPVAGALFDVREAAFEPVFGAHNAERLPDFWELDLRVDRSFSLGRGARLVVYLEGLNVLNHANAEEYVYNADYSARGVVTGLPALAVLGGRLEL